MTTSARYGVAAFLTVLLLLLGTSRANAGGAFSGETIIHVGDGGHEAWMIGQSQDVGYKCAYVAAFWMDLWSWGGTYCVYERFGKKYWPVSPAEAAWLLKKNESELQTPWQYRYPLGLFVWGPLAVLAGIGWLVSERARAAGDKATELAKDPKYAEAGAIAVGGSGAAAFEDGIQHLTAAGVDPAAADEILKVLVGSAVTCEGCGRRHLFGTAACGCGRALPKTPPGVMEPVKVERPFDIGKPLATPHPVSGACPQCGSGDYKSVQPATMVAFTWDRVCQSCSTRYTPPTPLWARFIFGGFGLAAVAGGAVILYAMFIPGKPKPGLGLITPAALLAIGFACLYKALTK